jgi:hypothetical protein
MRGQQFHRAGTQLLQRGHAMLFSLFTVVERFIDAMTFASPHQASAQGL